MFDSVGGGGGGGVVVGVGDGDVCFIFTVRAGEMLDIIVVSLLLFLVPHCLL